MGERITIKELYEQFASNQIFYMCDFVELLVEDKQVLNWEDDSDALGYYTQPRFQKAMSRHVKDFQKRKRNQFQFNHFRGG